MFSGRNTVPRPFFHARAKYHVTPGSCELSQKMWTLSFIYLGDSGKEKKKMDIKERRKSEVKEEENVTKKIKLEEPETPTEDENKEKKKKKKKMKSYLDDL